MSSIINWDSMISAFIGAFVALIAVWFDHRLQNKRERISENENYEIAKQSLWIELEKNIQWLNLVRQGLEIQFMGILKGEFGFTPLLGYSSSGFKEYAPTLMSICKGDIKLVHSITDVYAVMEAVNSYLKKSEELQYRRESYFWFEDNIVENVKRNRGIKETNDPVTRHERWRIQFFTAEARDYYIESCVAFALMESILSQPKPTVLSESKKLEILNHSINRLIELRDYQVSEYRTQGNPLADIILETVRLEHKSNPLYILRGALYSSNGL